MVMPKNTLKEISGRYPLDTEKLSDISGLGPKKIDKYGDEINNKESEEMMSMIMKEDLNLEDCLISVLLSLCPKKVEIIDDLKNETSKEIIENMKIIFEGNVNIVPKK